MKMKTTAAVQEAQKPTKTAAAQEAQKPNVIAYCRVSTDGQVGEDKYGIESQKSQITDFCEKKGFNIAGWFVDEGVSGAEEHRPAFDRILSGEVTNPPIDYVVVAKTDRISRDVNLYYAYKFMLQKLGLEILSVAEDWSAQDKMTATIVENILAVVATLERENIRARTSGGRSQKAKNGGYSGGRPPYGYTARNHKLEVVPKEAETVRRIFRLCQEGLSYRRIAEVLKKEDPEAAWSHVKVKRIVDNEPTYRGLYHYSNIRAVGAHEAILKEESE